MTVPPVPLAQTTFSLTTDSPRKLAVVLTFCFIHWAETVADKAQKSIDVRSDSFDLIGAILN
jgi:hypothetical protein